MNTAVSIFYAYMWVAAIGFPLALPFALANAQRWKHITGWQYGWKAGYMRAWEDQARDMLEEKGTTTP